MSTGADEQPSLVYHRERKKQLMPKMKNDKRGNLLAHILQAAKQ